MKKLHVHISVKDMKKSIDFYNKLFKTEPTKYKNDYAKWDLTDPAVNFSISKQPRSGLDHLGIQVEGQSDLSDLYQQADTTDFSRDEQGETVCCYARSEKSWIKDPQGINWELFHTMNDEDSFYGHEKNNCCTEQNPHQACC